MRLTGRLPARVLRTQEGSITWDRGRDKQGDVVPQKKLYKLQKELAIINAHQIKNRVTIEAPSQAVIDATPLHLIESVSGGTISLHASANLISRPYSNSKLSLGGRPADFMCSLPRGVRPFRMVNDEPLAELDLIISHSLIAFATMGWEIDFDVYELPSLSAAENERLRPLIKSFINTSLNLKPSDLRWWREVVVGAFETQKIKARKAAFLLGQPVPEGLSEAEAWEVLPDIKTAVEATYPELVTFFGTDFGVRAMAVEGDLAWMLLLAAAEEGFVLLPLFDGFFVHEASIPRVTSILKSVFMDITGARLLDSSLKITKPENFK